MKVTKVSLLMVQLNWVSSVGHFYWPQVVSSLMHSYVCAAGVTFNINIIFYITSCTHKKKNVPFSDFPIKGRKQDKYRIYVS